jgi:hypothetical protein
LIPYLRAGVALPHRSLNSTLIEARGVGITTFDDEDREIASIDPEIVPIRPWRRHHY